MGLLNRVAEVSMDERKEGITLRLKPASLTQAFEALDVEATAPTRSYTASFHADDDWFEVVAVQQAGGAPSPLLPVTLSTEGNESGFLCESEDGTDEPTFDGAQFEFTASLAPRAAVRINRRGLDKFEVALTGSAELDAYAGSIGFPVTFGGTVVCRVISRGYPLAYIPIVGPVGLSPTVALEIGVEAEAYFRAGEVTVSGPRVIQRAELAMGLAWIGPGGFSSILEGSLARAESEQLRADYDSGGDFMLRASPYAGAMVAVQPALGPWLRRGKLNLVNGEIAVSGRLEVGQGSGSSGCAANGGRGCLAACVSASLDPLRVETGSVVSFLRRISPQPADALTAWLASVNPEALYINNSVGNQNRCKDPWVPPVAHGGGQDSAPKPGSGLTVRAGSHVGSRLPP